MAMSLAALISILEGFMCSDPESLGLNDSSEGAGDNGKDPKSGDNVDGNSEAGNVDSCIHSEEVDGLNHPANSEAVSGTDAGGNSGGGNVVKRDEVTEDVEVTLSLDSP